VKTKEGEERGTAYEVVVPQGEGGKGVSGLGPWVMRSQSFSVKNIILVSTVKDFYVRCFSASIF
jgi:hypothetical protein